MPMPAPRVASVNQQIILSGIDWSADQRYLAYAMSTLPGARGVEIFTTDLQQNTVRKLTTGSNFGGTGASLRLNPDASQVYFSRTATPALRVPDTVKRVVDGVVLETLDRSELVLVQTPQAFRADVLRAAHVGAPDATDDAALVEAAGGRVVVVDGTPAANKITTPDDLAAMQRWLS